MKTYLFYFTGTGNSKMLAERICGELKDCTVLAIDQYDWKNKVVADAIGIVYPVYFWGIPNIVRRFLEQAVLPKTAYYFSVANMGGFAGNAPAIISDLLKKRGSTLKASFTIKMPDNYIVMMSPPTPEVQNKLFDEAEEQITEIVKVVSAKEETKEPRRNPLFSMVHNHYRKTFAERDGGFRVNDKCIACGLCVTVCPVQNIVLEHDAPIWRHHCEYCMRCLQVCPNEAINYGQKTIGRKRYRNPDFSVDDMIPKKPEGKVD